MAIQIANPVVVQKIEQLARRTGLSKTGAVEKAVDRLMAEIGGLRARDAGRMRALLAQLDRLPDRADAFDPLAWDERGLPR